MPSAISNAELTASSPSRSRCFNAHFRLAGLRPGLVLAIKFLFLGDRAGLGQFSFSYVSCGAHGGGSKRLSGCTTKLHSAKSSASSTTEAVGQIGVEGEGGSDDKPLISGGDNGEIDRAVQSDGATTIEAKACESSAGDISARDTGDASARCLDLTSGEVKAGASSSFGGDGGKMDGDKDWSPLRATSYMLGDEGERGRDSNACIGVDGAGDKDATRLAIVVALGVTGDPKTAEGGAGDPPSWWGLPRVAGELPPTDGDDGQG